MKTHPAYLLYAISALILLSAGCVSGPRRVGPATATAQAARAAGMATRMAQQLRTTSQAGSLQATATAEAALAGLETARAWPALLSDPFDGNASGWPEGESSDPLAEISWSPGGGRYRWEARAVESFVWWAIPELDGAADFYLAASVEQTGGPPDAECGLVFRLDSEQSRYYLFEINGQGQYSFFIHDWDGWEALIDWRESPAVQQDRPNRLEVTGQGPRFTFFINGQPSGGWVDERLERGSAGLLIGLSGAGDQGAWEFDDFELRAPAP